MNIDLLVFDKHHHLGENATGCSREFMSHATCLRNGTRLKAGMRPAGAIAHFSGFLAVKRGFQATCCLPAKRCSLAREHSRPTGLQVLFLVVEVQSTSSSRLARKPEKSTLAPAQQRNLS